MPRLWICDGGVECAEKAERKRVRAQGWLGHGRFGIAGGGIGGSDKILVSL